MIEDIKTLEAELSAKKKSLISILLLKRAEIDRQLANLGYGVKPKRKRRTKEEMAQARAAE